MRFKVLGPLIVVDDTGREIAVTASQRVLLTALLVCANRAVSLDVLTELVWDGAPPAGARDTLRTYVMRLRRTLGPGARVRTRSPGYLIEIDDGDLDLLGFEALCRDGVAAARAGAWQDAAGMLGQALGLWRGTPLQDVSSAALWEKHVPQLEELRLRALEWRIEANLHLGEGGELVGELRSLVAAHPLQERFHAQLMLALYRGSMRAEALDAFQRLRRMLIEELGTEPGVELQELHTKILTGDPDLVSTAGPASTGGRRAGGAAMSKEAAAPVPRQLPTPPSLFVGRFGQLKELDKIASSHAAVVISAIGGTAGVGKTALALEWAHRVAHEFPDGQLYIDLRGFDAVGEPLDPYRVIRGFLEALGVPARRIPLNSEAQLGLYRTLLADKRMLIVLDNARASSQVRPLLPGSRGSLVVVTSRRRLTGLIAEGARPLTVDLFSAGESRELLSSHLGAERVAAERPVVDELIEVCARLPLALSIVAARAAFHPGFSLGVLTDDLHDVQTRLDAFGANGGDVDVRAAFSWSYQGLGAHAARVFRLLGVHPGPDITVPAAASLAGMTLSGARAVLAELADIGLVGEHTPGRYWLHDLLRVYAAEQADAVDEQAERQAAVRRMLEHYSMTAAAAGAVIDPVREAVTASPPCPGVTPEPVEILDDAFGWFEAESNTLVAIIMSTVDTGLDPHLWRLCWALWPFYDQRGRWPEQLTVQRIALNAAERGADLQAQANTHSRLGRVLARLASYPDAEAHHRRALQVYEQLGESPGRVTAHYFYGTLLNRLGRHAEALDQAQSALTIAQKAGYRIGLGQALNANGWTHAMLGDYQAAVRYCQEAVTATRETGDRREEAHTWDSLGYAHRHLACHTQARDCYRRAVALFDDLANRYDQAVSLMNFGDTCAVDDDQAAREAWQQALAIFEELQEPEAADARTRLAQL